VGSDGALSTINGTNIARQKKDDGILGAGTGKEQAWSGRCRKGSTEMRLAVQS
jgi:hypothetical protein